MFSRGATLAHERDMSINAVDFNPLTRSIIECAIEVHRNTGAGLLESVYMPCMLFELELRGLHFVAQHPIPMTHKGRPLEASFRADLIVEETVLVELKSVETIHRVHEAQVLT